ncbi:TRAP-type mannitol/chloroaromatic compound transport system permease large subunit [Duganella sp. 1224]|nr:TRAP-type mannitol/chloroaromatic compound transport system permease large subunit [Duganella sp. 1224]
MTSPNNTDAPPTTVLEASPMEATFAGFVKLMDERQKVADARFDRIEAMLTEMRSSIASLRTTIVVTGITSVLAAVLGISAVNAALYSNMLAALSAGKEVAAVHAEVQKQAEETAALIRQMREREKQPPPSD